MADSVFTKIIKGEIPCHKVYEDDRTIAFMDIRPTQPGHVVVASKSQVETILDLNDQDAEALWNASRKVAAKLREVFPQKHRIAIVAEGLDVPHAHLNVFPIDNHQEFVAKPDDNVSSDTLTDLAKRLRIE